MSFLSRFLKPSPAAPLSPEAFVAQRDPAAPLLDVRTPAEYASGHLAGAVNVDVLASDFRARVNALKLPRCAGLPLLPLGEPLQQGHEPAPRDGVRAGPQRRRL